MAEVEHKPRTITWEMLGVHGPMKQMYTLPKDVVHHLRRFQVFQDSMWWSFRKPEGVVTHEQVLFWFEYWLKLGEPYGMTPDEHLAELLKKYPPKSEEEPEADDSEE